MLNRSFTSFGIVATIIFFMVSAIGTAQNNFIFGTYKKPVLLEKLEEYQEKEKANWENLWFYISYHHLNSATPMDVIPFAYTGYSGLHFGFLTDFGNIEDLESAPIVAITSGADPPIFMVAQNLEEFLSFICYAQSALLLQEPFATQGEFEKAKDYEFDGQEGTEYMDRVRKTVTILHDELNVPFISEDITVLMGRSIERRKKSVDVKTVDSLGLTLKQTEPIIKFPYSKDLKEIERFLDSSNYSSRLIFYRNATSWYILSEGYDDGIEKLIIKYLKKDGLNREAEVLEKNY